MTGEAMKIRAVLRNSFRMIKDNYKLLIPTTLSFLIIAILTVTLIGMTMPSAEMIQGQGANIQLINIMGLMFILAVFSTILWVLSCGIVVSMTDETIRRGSTSLYSGITKTAGKFCRLILLFVFLGITVTAISLIAWTSCNFVVSRLIGPAPDIIKISFFVVPVVLAPIFLMFTFIFIIVENAGIFAAVKRSFLLAKTNLKDIAALYAIIIITGIIFVMAKVFLGEIAIFGQLVGMSLIGLFWGFVSVILVKAYYELNWSA